MNLSLKSKKYTSLKAATAIALGLAVSIPILTPNLLHPLLVLAQKRINSLFTIRKRISLFNFKVKMHESIRISDED